MPRSRPVWAALCAALCSALPANAAPAQGAALKWVPPDAAAFVRFLPKEIWESPTAQDVRALYRHAPAEALAAIRRHAGLDPADLRRVTVVFPTLASLDRPFPNGNPTGVSAVFVLESARPFDRQALLKSLSTGGRLKRHAGADYYFHEDYWGALYLADDTTALFGSEDAVLWLLEHVKKPGDGPLTPALRQASGKALVAAGFNPAALPPGAAQAAPPPVAELLRAGCLGVTLDVGGGKLTLAAEAHFADAAGAAAGKKALQGTVALARQGLAVALAEVQKQDDDRERGLAEALAVAGAVGFLRHLDGALEKASVGQEGSTAWASASSDLLGAQGLPVALVGVVSMLGQTANATFQQVGAVVGGPRELDPGLKALHGALERYHKENGHYPPPAITAKDGTPLLSWRVALLPYLGEEALFKEFRLDEPWDSLHNKKLIARLPQVLRGGTWGEAYRTGYLGVAGPQTVFEGPTAKKRDDFKGRPGQPLLVVHADVSLAVYWTKPADLVVSPQAPLPRVSGRFAPSVNVLFADGDVRAVDVKPSPDVLRGLATGKEKPAK
jgi:hypothetical protein